MDDRTRSEAISLAGPVPPRKPLPYVAYVRAAQRNLISTYHEEAFRQPIVETRFPGLHNFIVNDPAGIRRVLLDNVSNYPKADIEHRILGPLLGNGLITSEGETWRAHRRMMASFFDGRSVERYAPGMADSARSLAARWEHLPTGAVTDISDEMMQVTLEIICRSMFAADSDELLEIVRNSGERYQKGMMFGILDFLPGVRSVWGGFKKRRGIHIVREVDTALYKLIQTRSRQAGGAGDDLLALLIRSHDDETGAGMSPREVRDEVLTIFAAGHETTAVALTWTWYLLAMHPAEEARLHEELDIVLGARDPNYDDVARLPYTRMVVQEAMRLYPAVYTLAWRQAAANDELCGRHVPRGATIAVVPWILHRHERFWTDPERFCPGRFTPEASAGREKFAYLPFSFGPRVCIGAAFAITEAVLVLATLARRYRLRLASGSVIEPQGLITLRARYGMPMTIEAR